MNQARENIAEIVNAGEKKTAPPMVPDESKLTPNGRAQWADCQTAARTAINKKRSNENFVIWPSADGKVPTSDPKLPADWPYDYKAKIYGTYGPFRVPIKVGDVPAGNRIYIYFYKGVP